MKHASYSNPMKKRQKGSSSRRQREKKLNRNLAGLRISLKTFLDDEKFFFM